MNNPKREVERAQRRMNIEEARSEDKMNVEALSVAETCGKCNNNKKKDE